MEAYIIGSHNAMTYLRPRRWWQWFLLPFARCQTKTIDQQLADGVRCFDIRIYFDKYGMVQFRHGWCEFSGDETIASVLTKIQQCPDSVFVRLILEEPLTLWNTIKKTMGLKYSQKPNFVNEYYFPRRCASYKKNYKGITFLGGYRKYDWKLLYDFEANNIQLYQWVASMDGKAPWWQRIIPCIYVRHHSNNLEAMKPGINLFDFVEQESGEK